jgi:hypothetical protein
LEYLATFYTHYGAMRFHKNCQKEGIFAKMMPVPRELSSSCGVCVFFEAVSASKTEEHEDMECCYALNNEGKWIREN